MTSNQVGLAEERFSGEKEPVKKQDNKEKSIWNQGGKLGEYRIK